MFNRNKATAGGRRLRATGGVPGMTEVLLLAAALLVILAPTYLSEAMSGVGLEDDEGVGHDRNPTGTDQLGPIPPVWHQKCASAGWVPPLWRQTGACAVMRD